jgi:hypothetical protein
MGPAAKRSLLNSHSHAHLSPVDAREELFGLLFQFLWIKNCMPGPSILATVIRTCPSPTFAF